MMRAYRLVIRSDEQTRHDSTELLDLAHDPFSLAQAESNYVDFIGVLGDGQSRF
jgi:hypothetical protein